MHRLLFINCWIIQNILLAPEDDGGSPTGVADTLDIGEVEDDNADGGEEDGEEKADKDKKDKSEGIEGKGKEGDEIELSTNEDEEVELQIPAKKSEILKKHPNIFKDFPELERSYYRDQQYREIFATPGEAKEASSRLRILDAIETDVLDGNIEGVLKSVKEQDANALNKIADDYLETLYKVDTAAYFHVVGNLVKRLSVTMVRDAKRKKDEGLEKAAELLYTFVFPNDEEFKEPVKLAKAKSEKEDEVKEERNKFRQERLDAHVKDLSRRVDNTIKNTILENIDKDGKMSAYEKKNAVRDAMDMLEDAIRSDGGFLKIQNRLWDEAEKSNFQSASLDKITHSYLGKSKSLLKDVIRKARAEALKDAPRNREEKDRKGPLPIGRNSASSNRGQHVEKKGKEIPSGISTKQAMDMLLGD